MRKAVAVPYIIALILGVAVIGLVGFWFASSGGKFSGQSAKTVCDNKFLQWCINPRGTFAESNPECVGIVSYNDCQEVLGAGAPAAGPPVGGGGEGGLVCQNGITLCRETNNCADCRGEWDCQVVAGGSDICVTT